MEDCKVFAENLVKIEDIKQEPVDDAEDNVWNFTEEGEPCSAMAEVKEEDEEEEVKPPVGVFLDSVKEVTDEIEKQPEDPLASCSEYSSISAITQETAVCSPDHGLQSRMCPEAGEKPFQCFTWENSFSKEGTLLKHKGSRNAELSRSKKNNQKEHSIVHVRRFFHTGEEPFQCSICEESFEYRTHLKAHVRTHTDKPYKCPRCGETYSQKGTLTVHMRTHTGEEPFQCSICEESFEYKTHLKVHVRTHIDKPYKCPRCSKTYSQKGSLTFHMRTHTGEEPFQCFICEKGFSEKGTLDRHMCIHIGEKPYQCSICEKGYRDRGSLNKHMRIHTTGKTFHCNICEISFSDKRTLREHILHIHTDEEKPFQCFICEDRFIEKSHLKQHLSSHELQTFSVFDLGDNLLS